MNDCPLTQHQLEIVSMIAEGMIQKQIPGRLGTTLGSVQHHIRTAKDALGTNIDNRMIAICIQRGWIRVKQDGSAEPARLIGPRWKPKELTVEQIQCLQALADGMTRKEAQAHIGLKQNTFERRMDRAREAMGVSTTTALVAMALRKGWIE